MTTEMFVVDASALVAHAKREPGWQVVTQLLADGTAVRCAHAIKLGEVLSRFTRVGAVGIGEDVVRNLDDAGVETRSNSDPEFWRIVAQLTSDFLKASLGDCFLIALAQRVGGTIVTADHPSFDPVVGRGICLAVFIR